MVETGAAAPRPTQPPSAATPKSVAGSAITPEAARYALGLLVLVYVVNFLDRTILAMLLEPIRLEFQVSDTYLGFLSGIAFAAFYTVMGIPIARWADRGNRRNIIALALLVWSGMTVLTGFARSFSQLALCRIGVGVGEAGCSPPAHSLISDYFPPERRGTAFSIYALGIPIGGGLGYLAGGWLNEFFDWRTAFILAGVPGIVLALVVRATLREPPRGTFDGAAAGAAQEPVRAVFSFMSELRSFRHMAIGAALHAFYGYGASAFIGAFFMRTHGIESGELGTWLALLGFTGGVAGTYLGGYLADRLGVRDPRWYMWVPALATIAYIPFAFLLYLWPDGRVALLLWLPGALLGGMYLGPTFAMTQSLVRPKMRAMASAILLFVINIIGLGLGPQGVGILSDLLAGSFGTDSLRYALLVVVVSFAAWSVIHYGLAARSIREDLQAARMDLPEERA
jgi:MFS family permease